MVTRLAIPEAARVPGISIPTVERRLVRRLEGLGYRVALEPRAA
jgi:hypothetical protein